MNCNRSSPNLLSMTINGAWDNSSVKNTSCNSHSTIIGPWSHEPPIDLFSICHLSQRYSRGPLLTNPMIIYLRTTSTSLFNYKRLHSTGTALLRPVQTLATLLANKTQHCWAQHVASVCTLCCVLLRLVGSCWMKFETGQTSSNNFQQVATRNNTQHGVQTLATCWVQQCCVLLANNVASVCTGLYGAKWHLNGSIWPSHYFPTHHWTCSQLLTLFNTRLSKLQPYHGITGQTLA